jgi:hypothetical protein
MVEARAPFLILTVGSVAGTDDRMVAGG